MLFLRKLLLLVPALGLTGCLSATNFQSPSGRVTDLSAYSLPPWEFRTGLGLVGSTVDDVGANIPFEVGLPLGFQIGTNVAHDVAALPNATLKWSPVDLRRFGFGVEVGIKYTNPSLMYFLPDDIREDYGDVDLLLMPLRINTTFPIVGWFDVHLDVGYLHTWILGTVETTASAAAKLGYRELFFDARLGFYAAEKVAIFVGGYFPVFATANVASSVSDEVEPGVVVGADFRGVERLDVAGLYTLYVQTEMRWGATHLRVGVVQFLRYLDQRIPYPLPTLDVFWRW